MEIEKRIEKLEERIDKTDERVSGLDKSVAVYSAIFEKNLQMQEKLSASIDKLSDTTVGLQGTLIGVQAELRKSSEEQEDNLEKIKSLEETTGRRIDLVESELRKKFGILQKDVEEVEERGKFDFLKFIKENLISLVLGIYIILDFIKNYTSGK